MKTTVANLPSTDAASSAVRLVRAPVRILLCLAAAIFASTQVSAQFQFTPADELDNLLFEAVLISDSADPPLRALAGDTTLDGSAPADPGLNILNSIATYQAAIFDEQEAGGLFSEKLREQYQALGLLQQQIGQHEAAVETFENAVHIARVNNGLYTLSQLDDIRHILASLEALGDSERELEYRNYLYTIHQKSFEAGDPQLLAAMGEWADWNLKAYQYSAGVNPRDIQIRGYSSTEEFVVIRNELTGDIRFVPRRYMTMHGSFFEATRHSVTSEMVVDNRLEVARDTYESMLEDGSETLSQQEKDAIRLKQVAAEYSFKRQMDMLLGAGDRRSSLHSSRIRSERDLRTVKRGLSESRDALQAMLEEQQAAPENDPLALAHIYLDLADFQFAYQQQSDAKAAYAKAWENFKAAGMSEEELTKVLQPEPLIPVPAFAPHPYSRELLGISEDDLLEYRGYIDTNLDINRSGNVRGIKITGESEGTSFKVRSHLLDYLKSQRMRPALVDGKPAEQKDLDIRFYYTY